MYCGMSFIIHNKEAYAKNLKKIKELLAYQNLEKMIICNASTIEYKENLFLIIDGYNSLLDFGNPKDELQELKEIHKEHKEDLGDKPLKFVDTRFLHNFLKYTYPTYAENTEELFKASNQIHSINTYKAAMKGLSPEEELYKGLQEAIKRAESCLTRENICFGVAYGEPTLFTSIMFETPEEEIEALSQDIYKATTEKTDVNNVKFIETLYECE